MSDELRFGIVSGDTAAIGNLCDALGEALGHRVVPRAFAAFSELRAAIASGSVDLAWSPPIAAVQLELADKVSFAVGVFREGGTSYSSAIFTAASSPVARVEQLRGRRVAWVDQESAAGYLLPRLKLASLGVPAESLAHESFEGTHDAVVRAVMEGRADAGATHVSFAPVRGNIESSGWMRAGYRMEDVRILATAGPIPPDAIVVSRAVPQSLQERLTDALIAIATSTKTRDDVERVFAGSGFVLVGRYQYDPLRALLR